MQQPPEYTESQGGAHDTESSHEAEPLSPTSSQHQPQRPPPLALTMGEEVGTPGPPPGPPPAAHTVPPAPAVPHTHDRVASARLLLTAWRALCDTPGPRRRPLGTLQGRLRRCVAPCQGRVLVSGCRGRRGAGRGWRRPEGLKRGVCSPVLPRRAHDWRHAPGGAAEQTSHLSMEVYVPPCAGLSCRCCGHAFWLSCCAWSSRCDCCRELTLSA